MPEPKGEYGQLETGRMSSGFLDQQFSIFHFKLLLAFHYVVISFYRSLLYTPVCISGVLKKVGVIFPIWAEEMPGYREYREVDFRANLLQQPIPSSMSLLQTHTLKESSMRAGLFLTYVFHVLTLMSIVLSMDG